MNSEQGDQENSYPKRLSPKRRHWVASHRCRWSSAITIQDHIGNELPHRALHCPSGTNSRRAAVCHEAVDLNANAPYRAFQLGMAEQDLDRREVPALRYVRITFVRRSEFVLHIADPARRFRPSLSSAASIVMVVICGEGHQCTFVPSLAGSWKRRSDARRLPVKRN